MPPINWSTVAAVLTSVAILMGGAAFLIRAIVRSELESLKSGFVTSELANERHEDHGRRITLLEKHVFSPHK